MNKPTGICSAHRDGEDENCKTCYPASSANNELVSVQRIKDHEIRDFVNELTLLGKEFGRTQQLRDRINREVITFLEQHGLAH